MFFKPKSSQRFTWSIPLFMLLSCNENPQASGWTANPGLELKRGDIILCGPPDQQLGKVNFQTSLSEKAQKEFEMGLALLHSFEYDEAEKSFAKVIDIEPQSAIAYWGVAMSNYHPLWAPPSPAELEKGFRAVQIGKAIEKKTKREDDYLNAIGAFYTDHKTTDHATRCNNFVKAMEKLYTDYPDDPEAGIFYALALNGAANPADKTFEKQKKAGVILDKLVAATPEHPGIIHYIIHSYDYPELATLALPAARKYASIAPSSAHAQHMPSHIFTRLGLWEEEIKSNIQSTESAKCYAESTGIKSHWDEELHGLDYLVYGYLQKGDNVHAKQQYDYLKTIKEVYPESFKVAYAYAAIPVRYMLENRLWKEASQLTPHTESFSWKPFPWQKSILHFGRAMGAVNTGDLSAAKSELKTMNILRDTLVNQKDVYKANQVLVQIKTVDAWINFKEGKTDAALKLMNEAAALEDNTQKHPVTPGEVLPARELLGDMLLQMKKPEDALIAYEASLMTHPNRFNGLYGAGMAAELSGNTEKAKTHFQQLVSISGGSERIEVRKAKNFLSKYNTL